MFYKIISLEREQNLIKLDLDEIKKRIGDDNDEEIY